MGQTWPPNASPAVPPHAEPAHASPAGHRDPRPENSGRGRGDRSEVRPVSEGVEAGLRPDQVSEMGWVGWWPKKKGFQSVTWQVSGAGREKHPLVLQALWYC